MTTFEDMSAPQFENANELRSYPFEETGSLVDKSGKELSRDVVVDLHVVAPYSGTSLSETHAWLSSAHLSGSMVSVCFSIVGGGLKSFLSCTVSRDMFSPYMPYRLEKLAGTEDAGGVVTFGDISFPVVPDTYFFENASIHPCCVSWTKPASLRKIVDPRSGKSLSGDVDISFSGHVIAEREGNSFRLSLEEGSADELASECAKMSSARACGATPISSISGVRPDKDGNIVLWFH